MTPTDQLRTSLTAASVEVTRRRAWAFIPGPDYVLGLPIRPLTLPVYSRLHAVASPFLFGGPVREGDIRNFLWFSSPFFVGRRWFIPTALIKWLVLLPFTAHLCRRRDVDWYCATLALASADVEAIIAEALADAPRGGTGAPGAALEAQFVHFCAQHYGWSPRRTRATPIKQLFQLFLCVCPADASQEEQSAKIAHLRRRNAELASARVSPTPCAAGGQREGENSGQTPGGEHAATGPASPTKPTA